MADVVYPGDPAGGPLNQGALPKNFNLVMYEGDYFELFVTIKDSVGAAVNLTGYTGKAMLKTSYTDASPVNFTVTIPTPASGIVRIYMSSTATAALTPGDFIWDFQLTSGAGDTRTYLAGDVTVYPEVTT